MTTKRKGLPLNIYTPSYGNCSNGGVSSRCTRVILVGPNVPEVFEESESSPAVEIKTGFQGHQYVALVDEKRPNAIGPMNGGCIVWSSDSRVTEIMKHPMNFHDRYETQEEYNSYST
jgi:hypothetical protein